MNQRRLDNERGYAMAALLIMLSVMSVALTMLLPAWGTMARREREAELVFRGQQYARAVAMYQRSRGAFPPSVDVLVTEKFLRKKYKDPMTENGEFQIIVVGMPIPGGATPPVVPGRGAGAAGGRGTAPGAGLGGGTGLGGGPAAGRGTETAFGRGTAPTLGTGAGAGTAAAPSGFNRVTREGSTGSTGPVLGVVSKSTQESLRLFNGRNKYSEWAFVATEATAQAGGGVGGTQTPGGRGGTQAPGMGGRGGAQAPGMQAPGMGGGGFGGGFGAGAGAGRGMPRGSGAPPLQLPGGRGRGGPPVP